MNGRHYTWKCVNVHYMWLHSCMDWGHIHWFLFHSLVRYSLDHRHSRSHLLHHGPIRVKVYKSCDHHVIMWSRVHNEVYHMVILHKQYSTHTLQHTTQWPCTLQGEEAQASRCISQWLPVKPVLQVQEKVSCPFVHVPPLWHGLERHWFKSISQSFPCMKVSCLQANGTYGMLRLAMRRTRASSRNVAR